MLSCQSEFRYHFSCFSSYLFHCYAISSAILVVVSLPSCSSPGESSCAPPRDQKAHTARGCGRGTFGDSGMGGPVRTSGAEVRARWPQHRHVHAWWCLKLWLHVYGVWFVSSTSNSEQSMLGTLIGFWLDWNLRRRRRHGGVTEHTNDPYEGRWWLVCLRQWTRMLIWQTLLQSSFSDPAVRAMHGSIGVNYWAGATTELACVGNVVIRYPHSALAAATGLVEHESLRSNHGNMEWIGGEILLPQIEQRNGVCSATWQSPLMQADL
jgi:hypothetical protein